MLSNYLVELWGQGDAPAALDAALDPVVGQGFLEGFVLVAANAGEARIEHALKPADGGPPPAWTVERHSMTTLDDADREEIDQALMQSWWFREAREVAVCCSERFVVTDHFHTGLDYKARLADLQRVLAGLMDALSPAAAWLIPSQQFIAAPALRQSFVEDDFGNPLPGAINVRSYEVPPDHSPDGEPFRLMDTLGLDAFGMTDLEIAYRGLDPEAVSQVLYNTALYCYERGPVLRSGETIQGPGSGDQWLLANHRSVAEPHRDVWRLDPGAPFSVALD